MRNLALVCVVAFACLSNVACDKKQDAQPDKAKVSDKKEEVPEDFVLNPFLPEQNGAAAAQGTVRGADGGLDPALLGGAADAAGGAGDAPSNSMEVVLVEPGAEPHVEQKYAFAMGKTETRVGVVTMDAGPEQQQPPIKITLAVTPTKKDGDKVVFALKATKFEMVAASEQDKAMAAQANQALAAAAGLTATLSVSNHGASGEVTFGAPQGPGARVAERLVPMLQPLLEIMFPVLPTQPIGVGAKWKQTSVQEDSGLRITVTTVFELVAADKDTLTVKAAITRKGPRQPLPEPPGATIEIDGTGSYEWTIKKTHAATKAKGESATTVKQSVPGKGEAARTIKTTESLDTPG